jgi:hypothetical protein
MSSIGEPVVHSNSPGAFDELERAVVDMRERFLSIGEHITGLLTTLTHQIDSAPHASRASIHGAADQIARTQQKLRLQMTNLPANPEERYQIMRSLLQAQSGALQQLSIIVQQYTPQVAAPMDRDGLATLSSFDNGFDWASAPRPPSLDAPDLADEYYGGPPRRQARAARPAPRPAKRPPAPARRSRGSTAVAIMGSRTLAGMAFTVAAAVVAYSYFPTNELRKMFRGYKPAAILTSNNDMGAKPAKDQTSLASSTEAAVLPERPQLARAQTAPEEPAASTESAEAPALPIRTQLLNRGAEGQGSQASLGIVVTTPTTLPTFPVAPRVREAAPDADQGGGQALLAPKPAAVAAVTAETEAAEPEPPRFVAVVFTHQDRDAALEAFADLRQRYPHVLSKRKGEAQPIEIADKGTWHRLVVLPAGTRQSAFGVCDRLEQAGYDRCWVKVY